MINGSCLCQAVKYVIPGTLLDITHCHCSMCRKTHGAAFATYARVAVDNFQFVQGEENMTYYNSSAPTKRGFCSTCGSQIVFFYSKTPEILWVTAGTFDNEPILTPEYHIFVASKAPWFHITDKLPQHDAYPKKK